MQVQLALQRVDWSEAGLLGLYKRGSENGNKLMSSVASGLGSLAGGGAMDSLPLDIVGSGDLMGSPSAATSMSPDTRSTPSLKGWRRGRKLRASRFMNSFCK
jgi:hypothetical protein